MCIAFSWFGSFIRFAAIVTLNFNFRLKLVVFHAIFGWKPKVSFCVVEPYDKCAWARLKLCDRGLDHSLKFLVKSIFGMPVISFVSSLLILEFSLFVSSAGSNDVSIDFSTVLNYRKQAVTCREILHFNHIEWTALEDKYFQVKHSDPFFCACCAHYAGHILQTFHIIFIHNLVYLAGFFLLLTFSELNYCCGFCLLFNSSQFIVLNSDFMMMVLLFCIWDLMKRTRTLLLIQYPAAVQTNVSRHGPSNCEHVTHRNRC